MSAPLRFPPDVMLLAAGLGRRMLPLTQTRPKPLIEVAGRALIDRVIDGAWAEGLLRFVVNTHHHADQLQAHLRQFERLRPGISIAFSPEPELLETGGGLKAALPLLATDPIMVINTDTFFVPGTDTPYARMVESFAANQADIVLLCVHPRRAVGFRRSHDFCLSPRGEITNDTGAPVIYAGATLIARRLIEAAPDGKFSLTRLFDQALADEKLYGVALDAPWLHVGDPQALVEAEAALKVSA